MCRRRLEAEREGKEGDVGSKYYIYRPTSKSQSKPSPTIE